MDELLPLYLGEAGDRLEKIESLLGKLDEDPEACRLIRRELHTLKGASRMMGQGDVADLCHHGEDILEDSSVFESGDFRALLDQVYQGLEQLRLGVDGQKETGDSSESVEVLQDPEPAPALRVPVDLLNELSDQSVRMRVLARESLSLIDGLYSMARTAEHAVSQRNQVQVLASLATRLRRVARGADRSQRRFESMVESQYRAFRSLQVQPVKPLLQQLARHARSLGESQAKDFEVKVVAEDTGLDRRIMEAIREALVHLVRNAVDHGLESPDERIKLGKEAKGHIEFRASGFGEHLRIEVEDDGRGIDHEEVLQVAVKRGLIGQEAARKLPENTLLTFLFEPGFTTRRKVSAVSGRGVGLDVVSAAVERVGGDVWIESTKDIGTRFVLEIPVLALAEKVLVIEAASFRVALAESQVQAFRQEHEDEESQAKLTTDGLMRLDLRKYWGGRAEGRGMVVEVLSTGLKLELIADDILGEEVVFLRQWPSFGSRPKWVEGLALLQDGRPVIVVDLHQLYLESRIQRQDIQLPAQKLRKRRVLLVDDSQITREMLRRALVEGGIEVRAVPSAQAAFWYLESRSVDCLLTDIEMPEMNGLELTRRIRATPEFAQLPIILISTRNSREDRMEGLSAGADAYFGKQNLDIAELLRLIKRFGLGQGNPQK